MTMGGRFYGFAYCLCNVSCCTAFPSSGSPTGRASFPQGKLLYRALGGSVQLHRLYSGREWRQIAAATPDSSNEIPFFRYGSGIGTYRAAGLSRETWVAAPTCTSVSGTVQLHGFYSGRSGRLAAPTGVIPFNPRGLFGTCYRSAQTKWPQTAAGETLERVYSRDFLRIS